MNHLLNELIITLDELSVHCHSLLDIMKSEKKAILKASVRNLDLICEKKENRIQMIQSVDCRRRRLLSELAIELNVEQKKLTVTGLATRVGDPYATPLMKLASNLMNLLKNIQEMNTVNQSLLSHSISLVRSTVGFLSSLLAPSPVYHRTGRIVSGDVSGRLLSGAA